MPNDEKAIRDVIAKWQAATAVGDLTQILGLMADDAVFLTPGQPPMNREAFAAAFQEMLQHVRIDSSGEIQEIKVMADWAYCWNYLSVIVTPLQAGPPVRRSGNTLTIFHKQADGAWVLARDANMLTVESSSAASLLPPE